MFGRRNIFGFLRVRFFVLTQKIHALTSVKMTVLLWIPKGLKVHFRKKKKESWFYIILIKVTFSHYIMDTCASTADHCNVYDPSFHFPHVPSNRANMVDTAKQLRTSGFSRIHSASQWRRTKDGGAEGAGPSVSAEIPVSLSERQDLRWWWFRANMEEHRGRGPHLFLLSEQHSSEEKGPVELAVLGNGHCARQVSLLPYWHRSDSHTDTHTASKGIKGKA